MSEKHIARLGEKPEDYERLGMKPGSPELWEDGVRTEGKKGEYEWWYFDGKLDGGASLVAEFHTTPLVHMKNEYEPFASIHLTYPDGTEIKDEVRPELAECSFSKERCYAKIGDCIFEGDLHTYHIHFSGEKVQADIQLVGKIPPWRPATGFFLYGKKDYFAWLPSVPEGLVNVTFTCDGRTEQYTGTGYHDHNWGNVPMNQLMHHWYWGRAKIGEYQAICCYITAQKKYGYTHFPIFLLAKNGQVLGEDAQKLTYSQSEPEFDRETGKHIHKKLVYDYDAGGARYQITFQMEQSLSRLNMKNSRQAVGMPWFVRAGMKLLGLDPSYHRVSGQAVLEKTEAGETVETVTAPALWEQMYFGADEEV